MARPRKNVPMSSVTIRLPASVHDAYAIYALRTGTTIHALMLEALTKAQPSRSRPAVGGAETATPGHDAARLRDPFL